MAKAKQPVSINGVEFDALIDEDVALEADIPEYPVETGFVISDTVILKPKIVSMTLYVTNTPVTWKRRFGTGADRAAAVCAELQELYLAKELVTLSTTDGAWENMGIQKINFRKSAEIGYALEIPVILKEVRFTESATVDIPDTYGRSGATEAPAGTAGTSGGTAGSSASGSTIQSDSSGTSSLAYGLASAAGLFK